MLQATYRPEKDVLIVNLAGTATEALASPVPVIMRYVEKKPRALVLNMRGVHYINSAGLSAIIGTFREASRREVPIAFCEMQAPVLKVFKLARVEIFVPTFDTEREALRYFGVGIGAKPNEPGVTVPLPRENLLVIQKDLQIAEGLRAALTQVRDAANYKITVATSDEDTQNWLSTKRFDVLALDVTLPRAFVEKLIRFCRTAFERQAIPIVIVSPDAKFAEADYYVRYGADEMLRFPLNAYETSTRLRSVISAAKAFDDSTRMGDGVKAKLAG